jgi:ATP-binding cassette subfamily B protein
MKHILRILGVARELRHYYVWISILTILSSLTLLLVPMISGWVIDEVQRGTQARVSYVVILALVLFGLDLAGNLLNNYNGFLGDQLRVRLYKTLGMRYYEHLLKLPQSYFDQELTGKLIARLNRSVMQITDFVQMMSNNFLQFLLSTVLSLAVVAYYSWPVALMLFLLYPIFTYMTIRSSNRWQQWQGEINTHQDVGSGRFAEAISQVKVVKSFIQEKRELKFFQREVDGAIRLTRPQSRYWHTRDVRRNLVLNFIFLGVYLYIFVTAAQGSITPGVAVALILYAQQIRLPIFTISFLVENTQKAVADSRDYFEIMALEPQIADHPGAGRLRVSRGEVKFQDVAFGYDQGKTVLHDVNFVVQPDSKVALVGESGEGKTTLTNLLLRLYEPQQGSITIDGVDISEVTQASLRDNIGVVFQEPALFSGTIRENIGYARSKVTQSQIVAAAKAANAHEFIEKFEKGYDTEIGERGLKLSGGQKQRIAIARALLKDAPILILDEATSSLDSRSEQMVQEALNRLMHGRTTIIIAHRLSTIAHVDQIITLSGGTVDEIGTPAQLAKSGGIYAQLLQLQRGGVPTKRTKQKLQAFELVAK